MHLVIDIGNTLTKVAVFHQDQISEIFSMEQLSRKNIREICQNRPDIKAAIVSTVKEEDESIIPYLQKKYRVLLFDHHTPLPVKIRYKTPESLGLDRLAAACAAKILAPGENILVIDAGTCIKYDLVNVQGEYFGGGISPGVQMRLKAMNAYTGKLPLVTARKFDELLGDTTEKSMLSGVMNGALFEMQGMIAQYQEKHSVKKVILSGGDMNYFADRLKSSIFAVPNIVLIGLNEILKFNVDKQN